MFSSVKHAGCKARQLHRVQLGDVHFSQDSIRAQFRDGRSIYQLKEAFSLPEADPDAILRPSFIEILCYKGKWYSMDNRRLWCLKEVFPAERLVSAYVFPDEDAYNSKYGRYAWAAKYSTICGGIDIIIQPVGHKRVLARTYGSDIEERHCKVKCTEVELLKFVSSSNLISRHHLKDVYFKDSICVIMGAKRDVDMAGAIIFDTFVKNYEEQPRLQLKSPGANYFLGMQAGVERSLHKAFAVYGAPEWGTEDGIARMESKQRSRSIGNARAIQDTCYDVAVKGVLMELLENKSVSDCFADERWAGRTAQSVHQTLICAIAGFDHVREDCWRKFPDDDKLMFMVGVAWEHLHGELCRILEYESDGRS
eukprot:TRINITY_DN13386_c0_g1_i2.p1 TRINITY_DN13386_c0_g1~~TRINITY_DN13386_c0_g1_i2.p1  ORF type:complete len:366 (+),score=52.75 TRINITY_DN13386_c0_g1_i2:75-1172(+)